MKKQELSGRLRSLIVQAGRFARELGHSYVGTEHLLLALMRDDGCTACRILTGSGMEPDCIFTETFGALRTPEQTQQGRQTSVRLLEQYCENMIEKAARMEPVVGRERELCEVEQILCRKNKNNPALIGEPGVGKTAIVEALAQRLASGQAPQGLLGNSTGSIWQAFWRGPNTAASLKSASATFSQRSAGRGT